MCVLKKNFFFFIYVDLYLSNRLYVRCGLSALQPCICLLTCCVGGQVDSSPVGASFPKPVTEFMLVHELPPRVPSPPPSPQPLSLTVHTPGSASSAAADCYINIQHNTSPTSLSTDTETHTTVAASRRLLKRRDLIGSVWNCFLCFISQL